jgi:hypothetical protein
VGRNAIDCAVAACCRDKIEIRALGDRGQMLVADDFADADDGKD